MRCCARKGEGGGVEAVHTARGCPCRAPGRSAPRSPPSPAADWRPAPAAPHPLHPLQPQACPPTGSVQQRHLQPSRCLWPHLSDQVGHKTRHNLTQLRCGKHWVLELYTVFWDSEPSTICKSTGGGGGGGGMACLPQQQSQGGGAPHPVHRRRQGCGARQPPDHPARRSPQRRVSHGHTAPAALLSVTSACHRSGSLCRLNEPRLAAASVHRSWLTWQPRTWTCTCGFLWQARRTSGLIRPAQVLASLSFGGSQAGPPRDLPPAGSPSCTDCIRSLRRGGRGAAHLAGRTWQYCRTGSGSSGSALHC